MSLKEIRTRVYNIRKYIVPCPVFADNSPAWYNEVMDDIDYIFDWIENIKDVEQEEEVACDEAMKDLI